MSVSGAKAHASRLKRMTAPQAVARVGKALFKAGLVIQNEAQLSITRGSVTGKRHVASRPGQAPNADTRVLDKNIETVAVAPLRVTVSSNAPYAIPLELGSSKMAARPYMRPAVAKKRVEVTRYIAAVVKNITEGR